MPKSIFKFQKVRNYDASLLTVYRVFVRNGVFLGRVGHLAKPLDSKRVWTHNDTLYGNAVTRTREEAAQNLYQCHYDRLRSN